MNKYKNIDEFLKDQSPEKIQQIAYIQNLIMDVEPSLTENLKWNAPNYVYNGEDRITLNLMNKEGKVKIILHMGATKQENKKGPRALNEDQGIIDWNSDIRGTICFEDLDDIKAKKAALSKVVADWLSIKT